ncbi:hypothetical protein PLEOSDRAFT_1020767, partial [Pleurotus ostreatus PC15]
LELFGQQVDRNKYAAIQRNTVVAKDSSRSIPKPVVITIEINGSAAVALLDSGLLGDFMSCDLADQLVAKKIELATPLPLQLAVQGSRSKVNWGCRAWIAYQSINEERYFDIINLSNYDLILGTPWIFQHKILMGLNPPRVVVGSKESLPFLGDGVTKVVSR